MRTRIKICGITSVADAHAAVEAGTDALGFVFYPPSPRYVRPDQAATICAALPPFVTRVAVFANPTQQQVEQVLNVGGIDTLQFHGDESPAFCASFARPYMKTARVRPELDLLNYLQPYASATGWLLDTYRDDLFGGIGAAFDWSLIPARLERPIVLSGGLDPDNVAAAVTRLRPWGVDVSSGVELERDGKLVKGRKDPHRIARFIAQVRNADR